MKIRNILRALTSFVLVLTFIFCSTGCAELIRNISSTGEGDTTSFPEESQGGSTSTVSSIAIPSDITSLAAQDYISLTIEDDLQESLPEGYTVDYVESIYISEEYVEELYYNSLNNVYFGYDYDEVASYMQDKNWAFTVGEDGQTVVYEVPEPSNELVNMLKKIAIGVGVIVVCVVVSYATAGVGTGAVACFFAGAAKGALVGAVSGAAVSGVIGGAVQGIKTQSWEGALKGAASGAADGFMWGAISGALVGGFTSTACFVGDTPVRTLEGYKPISEISKGDFVYSYNELTGEYSYQPVLRTTKRTAGDIVTLTVGGEQIVTTSNHPFYTDTGWTDAADLAVDSRLLGSEGYIPLASADSTVTDEELWVYNLNVAYNHTYTVSALDIVVHNACGDSAKLRQNLIDAGDAVPDYPNAAHHIVPSSDARFAEAIQARDKLISLGIDINDASNGVFLSTSKSVAGTTYHRTLHTAEYYQKVNSLLSNATTKSRGLAILADIKASLMNGTFLP